MIFFKILNHIGTIVNILSYINLIASILANKTNNPEAKKAANLFSKFVSFLALNFNVKNLSDISKK